MIADALALGSSLVGGASDYVKVRVGGTEFKLEANATANAKGLADEFTRAKAAAAV